MLCCMNNDALLPLPLVSPFSSLSIQSLFPSPHPLMNASAANFPQTCKMSARNKDAAVCFFLFFCFFLTKGSRLSSEQLVVLLPPHPRPSLPLPSQQPGPLAERFLFVKHSINVSFHCIFNYTFYASDDPFSGTHRKY